MRVLVTEDDDDLRLSVTGALRGAGFAVDAAADLPDADLALGVNTYDCAVFDRKLPAGDALDFVRARRLTVPIVFLTALDSTEQRLAGLSLGDYLVKPFAMEELVARVGAACRRVVNGRPPVLRCGDLEIDTGRHEVRRAGALLYLTSKEFAVLEHLVANQGTPVPRAELLRHGWDEMIDPASNVLDGLIKQLRRKLHDPPMIHTARGVGYRIDPA